MAKAKQIQKPNKIRIRKNDKVSITTGKDLGKTGKVLKVLPKSARIIVEGINFIKRHQKPSSKQQKGGIIEKEGSIHISNVLLVCSKCGKPTRISVQNLSSGGKTRICKKCGEIIDK